MKSALIGLIHILLYSVLLLACSHDSNPYRLPPVQTAEHVRVSLNKACHRVHYVEPGETLYSIAWRYDMDYRNLARFNEISPPYTLSVAKRLTLCEREIRSNKKAAPEKKKQLFIPVNHHPQKPLSWSLPIRGKITQTYDIKKGHKGIYFEASKGTFVRAAQAGRVAYAGNGLHGYGNLIIIKHDYEYLSAYGHNRRIFVKEGQLVAKNQKIAEIGDRDQKQYHLYFEIRRSGQVINPLHLLKVN